MHPAEFLWNAAFSATRTTKNFFRAARRDISGRSVTLFAVVRRRKGSLFFCSAKRRDWAMTPIPAAAILEAAKRSRGEAASWASTSKATRWPSCVMCAAHVLRGAKNKRGKAYRDLETHILFIPWL